LAALGVAAARVSAGWVRIQSYGGGCEAEVGSEDHVR
jgi:hypothetical protein